MLDKENDPDVPREIRIRQLAMMASRLIQVFDDTWSTYLDLFGLMDLEDFTTNAKATDAILELEGELARMLGHVRDQVKMLDLPDEPIPTDVVDDFESSVLTTLAKLDTIDLEQFRKEEKDG